MAYHSAAGATIVLAAIRVYTLAVAFDAVSALRLRHGGGGRGSSARDRGDSGAGARTAIPCCS